MYRNTGRCRMLWRRAKHDTLIAPAAGHHGGNVGELEREAVVESQGFFGPLTG